MNGLKYPEALFYGDIGAPIPAHRPVESSLATANGTGNPLRVFNDRVGRLNRYFLALHVIGLLPGARPGIEFFKAQRLHRRGRIGVPFSSHNLPGR